MFAVMSHFSYDDEIWGNVTEKGDEKREGKRWADGGGRGVVSGTRLGEVWWRE